MPDHRHCQAICFDLDGTLLDTVQDLAAALNRVLEAQGYPTHPLEDHMTFIGDGARALVERALPPAARSEAQVTQCLAAFRADYGANWKVQTRLFPGIRELLTLLQDTGVKLSILSNKPHPYTVQCAQHYLGEWPFDPVRGQQEHVPKKPEPTAVLHIAQAQGIAPEQFSFVGDSGVDMQTAVAAGMMPIGVTWGYRHEDELRANGARHIIHHPLELLPLCQ